MDLAIFMIATIGKFFLYDQLIGDRDDFQDNPA
jgi:hypothetical protein